jgi:hypothetical protein
MRVAEFPAQGFMCGEGLCGDSRHRLSAEQSSVGFDSRTAPAMYLEIFEKLEKLDSKLEISLMVKKASFARPDSRWRLSPHKSTRF